MPRRNEIATKSDVAAIEKHLVKMDAVVTEYLKGMKPVDIAAKVGMSTSTVNGLLKEWRASAANNADIRERADVALRDADEHYSKLISKAYETMENAELNDSNTQKISAIKLIADLEKARIDSLHRAGLLEDNEISRQLIETERKQQILIDVLRSTVGPCNRCRPIVQEKLEEATKDIVIIKG